MDPIAAHSGERQSRTLLTAPMNRCVLLFVAIWFVYYVGNYG